MNISREICGNSSGRSLSITTAEESKAESIMANRIKNFSDHPLLAPMKLAVTTMLHKKLKLT